MILSSAGQSRYYHPPDREPRRARSSARRPFRYEDYRRDGAECYRTMTLPRMNSSHDSKVHVFPNPTLDPSEPSPIPTQTRSANGAGSVFGRNTAAWHIEQK